MGKCLNGGVEGSELAERSCRRGKRAAEGWGSLEQEGTVLAWAGWLELRCGAGAVRWGSVRRASQAMDRAIDRGIEKGEGLCRGA